MEYFSGLDEKDKKSKHKKFELIKNLTVWSDLLGFSNDFCKNGWILNKEQWEKIDLRLKNFYRQHYLNISSLNEYIFILNDGVVRTIPLVYNESSSVMNCYPLNNHIYEISMWIRTVISSHINVNNSDKIGARTVLSYGERFNSFLDEVTVDDLVYNYTKRDLNQKSQLAINTGDYTLMHNPRPLQMNTALSKSYILESLGSKAGLKGNSFFIDKSFFEYIKSVVQIDSNLEIIDNEELFAIKYTDDLEIECNWLMGFDIEKIIPIFDPFITTVYKIKSFYPVDENPREFKFNL
ncbi:hypothetical protein [Aliarcobacter skirrowii]|uniref:hypothetical protein n=1 Tax=Aliarcobacter skirrowii TaxID=28200 RepID=UPI0029B74377|nr:hypothetical protein [Aliarcobacter skirrowii]MDX4037737.1 hypothetical protein [Aliarcobacter skirrowii]